MGVVGSLSRGKTADLETHDLTPFGVEVVNDWRCILTPPIRPHGFCGDSFN